MRDYAEDYADANFKFPSKDLDGAPTAIVSGAFAVYKSNSTTQSTAGLTFTSGFDGVTGFNNIKIDLSADAFYETGEDYSIVATAGTVDSISIIGEVVAEFSIENQYMRGTDGANTVAPNTVVPPTVAQFNARTVVSADYATAAELAKVPKSDGTTSWNATALAAINAEADTALADYDGPTNAEMVARTLLAADYFDPSADTVANVTTVATTTTNTDMRGTDSALLAVNVPTNFSSMVISAGGSVDALVQGYLNTLIAESTAGRIADNFDTFYDNSDAATSKVLDDVGAGGGGGSGWTASEKNEIRGRLGITGTTAAGGNTPDLALETTLDGVETKIDTIDANVDAVLVDTGTTIPDQLDDMSGATFNTSTDSLEAIRDRGDAAWLTGAGGSAPTVGEIADAVWDEAQSGHTTAGTFGDYLDSEVSAAGGGSAPTAIEIRQEMDNNSTQLQDIVEDTSTTLPSTLSTIDGKIDTIDTNVDSVLVDTGTTLPASIATVDANVDAVLVDTGTTLPSTLSTMDGKLDTIDGNVDSVLTDTGTTIPATLSTIDGKVDTLDTNVDAILVDTSTTIPADLTTIESKVDTVDTNVDSVLVDTGTTIPAQISGLNDFDPASDTVDIGKINGDATSASNLEESAKAITQGTAVTGTLSTTQMSTDLTESTDDHYKGLIIKWTSGSLLGQGTDITAYDGTTKVLTFTATTGAPSNNDTFVIL